MTADLIQTVLLPLIGALVALVMAMVLWEMRSLVGTLMGVLGACGRWVGLTTLRGMRRMALRMAWWILMRPGSKVTTAVKPPAVSDRERTKVD